MKFQLESKLMTQSGQIRCVVCGENADSHSLRTLLCNDQGWILGDLCGACTKLSPPVFKQKLRTRSSALLREAQLTDDVESPLGQLAQDLLAASQEALKKLPFFAWWLKKIEILAEETQELETARLASSSCLCRQRSQLNPIFHNSR